MARGRSGSGGGAASGAVSSILKSATGKVKKAPHRVAKPAAAKNLTAQQAARKAAASAARKAARDAAKIRYKPTTTFEGKPDKHTVAQLTDKLNAGRFRPRHGQDAVPSTPHEQAAEIAFRRASELHYPRQTFSQQHREAVWNAWAGPGAKTYVDVGGRTIDRHGNWQMGHVPGHEHRTNVEQAVADGTDPKAFKDDYLDTDNYRPEHWLTNQSHAHEAD